MLHYTKKVMILSLLLLHSSFIQPQPHNHLTVICGSMASGKSDEFIRWSRRRMVASPDEVCVFKHVWDNRVLNDNNADPATHVSSRSGSSIKCIGVLTTTEMENIIQEHNYSTIAIDEAQFFDKNELLAFVRRMLSQKKDVIVAGLDLDFRGETFGAMGDLLALADTVVKLKAICSVCKQDKYCITQRTIDGKPAYYQDPIVMVGESDYTPRCRDCHTVIPGSRPTDQKNN
jgi:thymidine kinase